MRIVVVVLVAAVALTGCGKRIPDGVSTPPPATPTSVRPDPAEVQEIEAIVNGLDGVVGSAEADTDTGND
jgi:hypothetical protein